MSNPDNTRVADGLIHAGVMFITYLSREQKQRGLEHRFSKRRPPAQYPVTSTQYPVTEGGWIPGAEYSRLSK
jgi:hypothetical protein